MRILILITTLVTLFGALLPASAVSASSTFNFHKTSKPILTGLCYWFAKRAKQCERSHRYRNKTLLACDQIEAAQERFCGTREVILVSSFADDTVIDLLRWDYEIVPLEDAVFPYNHIVIDAQDLQNSDVVDLLRKAHQAGKTVAIAKATEAQVRQFHGLVRTGEDSDCKDPDNPNRVIQLYGLQQTINPLAVGSYCLHNLDHRDRKSDRRWLRDRFAAQVPGNLTPVPIFSDSDQLTSPVVQQQQSDTASMQELTSLANGKTCSYKSTDTAVGSTSWNIQVWGMRNFTSLTDYYLVDFNSILSPLVSNITFYQVNSLELTEIDGTKMKNIVVNNGFILNVQPATVTKFVDSWTNSESHTVSGSVGVNGMGVSAGASDSVTIGNSMTTSTPPVTILNEVDTITLEPSWTFVPQSTPAGASYDPVTTWIWQLPQAAYPLGGEGSNQISFLPGANIFSSKNNTTFISSCNVTVPFTTWTVNAPILTTLSPASAKAGDQVTVTGQHLYPSIITAVLIGGTNIPTSNLVFTASSTSFIIVVPNKVNLGSQNVQVRTTVSSNESFLSNSIPLFVEEQ